MGTLADSMGVTSEKKRLRRSPLASFRMMAAISKSFPFTSYKKTNKQKAKITHHIRLERHQGNERKQQKNRLKNKNKRKAHLAVGIGVELEAQVEVRVGQAETVARRAEERQSRVRVVDADVVLQIAPDRLAIRQVLVAVRRPAPRPPKTPKKNKQKNKQTNSVMSRAENEPDIWPGRRVPRKNPTQCRLSFVFAWGTVADVGFTCCLNRISLRECSILPSHSAILVSQSLCFSTQYEPVRAL